MKEGRLRYIMKTILITGATDGIGLETAKALAAQGHTLLIHGRSSEKLARVKASLSSIDGSGIVEAYEANFSSVENVETLACEILSAHKRLDVLINNAGVYKTSAPRTEDGYDLRFVVNLFAPVSLTLKLLPIIPVSGRIVNLSSAAQASVDLDALRGTAPLGLLGVPAPSRCVMLQPFAMALGTALQRGVYSSGGNEWASALSQSQIGLWLAG